MVWAARCLATVFLAVMCVLPPAAWGQQAVHMSSLEWPPYTGKRLPRQGASTVVVREVLRQAGLELKLDFFPWSRAVDLARNDARTMAYFPEYFDSANAQRFLYSDPIGSGPLVFAQRRDAAIPWLQLEELTSVRIGVVRGYFNTRELDERISQGRLQADEALDDSRNLLKLAGGRIDLAVVDANVFHFLVRHNPEVAAVAPRLELNRRVLEDKHLYVCFKNTPEGRALRDAFNRALKRVDPDALMRTHLARANSQ
jgi:polar amino acid transport system substrate-binding protein